MILFLLFKFAAIVTASNNHGPKWDRNCFTLSGVLICFRPVKSSVLVHSAYEQYILLTSKVNRNEYESWELKPPCDALKKYKNFLNFSSETRMRNISIILYTSRIEAQAGNMLGFFWEILSFCVENGVAFGRLTSRREGYMSGFHSHLPELIIPAGVIRPINCSTFDTFYNLRENPNAIFWRYHSLISTINHIAVNRYVKSSSLESLMHSFAVNRTVTIHLRCGDNLYNKRYGIIGFDMYKKLLSSFQNNYSYSIITDSSIKFNIVGNFCWKIVGYLKELILSVHSTAVVNILHAQAEIAFAFMNLADVLVCSPSTFCFYAAYGSKQSFIPGGDNVLRYPANISTVFSSSFQLFETEVFHVNISQLDEDLKVIVGD